jgi:hypothetical protein
LKEPGTCKACPNETAVCYGGNKIGPKAGYWRKNYTTSNFIKCPNTAACLGIIPPKYNELGECADSYEGILCSTCIVGYSKTDTFKCSKCPPYYSNAIRLIFILIAAIFVVVYLVRSTLKGAKEEKNITSIYIKILMNHL